MKTLPSISAHYAHTSYTYYTYSQRKVKQKLKHLPLSGSASAPGDIVDICHLCYNRGQSLSGKGVPYGRRLQRPHLTSMEQQRLRSTALHRALCVTPVYGDAHPIGR